MFDSGKKVKKVMQERMKTYLEEAESFFEEVGIQEKVNSFLASEEVTNIVKEYCDNYEKEISEYCQNVPKEFITYAEKLKLEYVGKQDEYKKNLDDNFKRRLAASFKFLSEFVGKTLDVNQIVDEELNKESGQKLTQDVYEILREMNDALILGYEQTIFQKTGYYFRG